MRPFYTVVASVIIFFSLAIRCEAQWTSLTQPELREVTESLVKNQSIAVNPPWIQRLQITPTKSRLGVCLGNFPRSLTDDERFNRVLNAQIQVSLIRTYRNQPAMIQNWAPTLGKVENRTAQMLLVLSSGMTDEQKQEALATFEDDVDSDFDKFFADWATTEGRFDWGSYGAQEKVYAVRLTRQPPATVRYMCAGTWELYLYAKKQNRNLSSPVWQVATKDKTQREDSVSLAGDYYFYAQFEKSQTSPVRHRINKDMEIHFEP